ncbi:MAG: monofunctional biosynthetic peptidoglycan transglycosylase [Betaproteobacteria bacterium]|jgi:monofunctional biosynthetic peptidoglycan transglycosylase|nr:monofunctional biosynthetic peptidoglycan transglycosylase [Betaproteobacteria bacterium]MDH5343874.1 monofunctional biosynthetic peptidoglycan transglycosylase [Betaproteobacteria bacterium]
MLRFIWRWTWRALLLALIVLAAVQFWFLVHVWYWVDHNPESTAFMRARLEILREDDSKARLRHQWVPYRRISNHLKRAVVAAEDAKFVAHRGFDWDGIQKAYEKNLREGEIVAGGSTITQQLAKNLFFSGERAWWRKAQEAAVAVMLETIMSKRRILEIYLNVIEWGDGVFGAEAAARYHYGSSAANLGDEQAARLAAIVPSPRRYGPASNTGYLQQRTQIIMSRMNGARVP